MQSRHYRLGRNIHPNRIIKDIEIMIKDHAKLHDLDDTILTIELKDISCTYDLNEKRIIDDRETKVRE